jgi:hypothetical protein
MLLYSLLIKISLLLQCCTATSLLGTFGLSRALRLFQQPNRGGAVDTLPSSLQQSTQTDEALQQSKQKRLGVLLLNLGGPEKQEVLT